VWGIEPENVVVKRRAAASGCVETAEQAAARHVHEQVTGVFAPPEYFTAHDVVEVVGMGVEFALRKGETR
jgi:hypothetical protein